MAPLTAPTLAPRAGSPLKIAAVAAPVAPPIAALPAVRLTTFGVEKPPLLLESIPAASASARQAAMSLSAASWLTFGLFAAGANTGCGVPAHPASISSMIRVVIRKNADLIAQFLASSSLFFPREHQSLKCYIHPGIQVQKFSASRLAYSWGSALRPDNLMPLIRR